MKPCANNRKQLSWLAIDALDQLQARKLRAHVETCPGCQRYLEEMSNVAGNLTVPKAASEIEASAVFHRNLTRRIEAAGRPGMWPAAINFLAGWNWRVAVPAGFAMAVVVILITLRSQHEQPLAGRVAEPMAVISKPSGDATLTFGNYRMLANRSLDALDQELTREAETSRKESPSYTVSSIARSAWAD